MKLYSSKASKKIDELAIFHLGFAETFLIEKAASAALDVIQSDFPKAQNIYIFAGIGNNGADGLVLGKLASTKGYRVQVILFSNKEKSKLAPHYQAILNSLTDPNLNISHFEDWAGSESSKQLNQISDLNLIVDAIFGIGLNQAPRGHYKKAIGLINQSTTPVLSIDIPSGLSADTGQILGVCVKADKTLTYIVHKFGCYTADGVEVCGEIRFNDLGIQAQDLLLSLEQQNQIDAKTLEITSPSADVPNLETELAKLPTRKKNSHKNNFGTALLIGGNHHMAGAITLAALASLKMGSGLTWVLTRSKTADLLPIVHPELMTYSKKSLPQLLKESKLSALAIGPGLGQDEWARSLFAEVIECHQQRKLPLVIDADGLNLLAKKPKLKPSNHWVLTPHPKEAARLLNVEVNDIQANRLGAIRELQEKFGGVAVLKGKGTLIYDGKQCCLCPYGNSGMAKGGMGDLLTGMIVGLLAQGIAINQATLLATLLHSYYADEAVKKTGLHSLTPTDVIQAIKL